MTNRDKLIEHGYLVFSDAMPKDLCERSRIICDETANARDNTANFTWTDPVSMEFRAWCRGYLEAAGLGLSGWETDLHVFNRRPGLDPQAWHNDDQAQAVGLPFGSLSMHRIFVCTYFVSTFEGRAPLRVIPGSHRGGYDEFRRRSHDFRLKSSKQLPLYDPNEDIMLNYRDLFAPHPDQALLEVPAGSVIAVSERMLHGTGINEYPDRRPMALWWLML